MHEPIVGVLDSVRVRTDGPGAARRASALMLVVGVPVVLALCYGFHSLFEAPFLRHRDLGALRTCRSCATCRASAARRRRPPRRSRSDDRLRPRPAAASEPPGRRHGHARMDACRLSGLLPLKISGRHYGENLARLDLLFSSLLHYTPTLLDELLVVARADEADTDRRDISRSWPELPFGSSSRTSTSRPSGASAARGRCGPGSGSR